MTSSFEKVLQELCEEGLSSLTLPYTILRYCELTCKLEVPTRDYYHKLLFQLPWSKLRPDLQLISSIAQVCERWNESELDFLHHLILQINWNNLDMNWIDSEMLSNLLIIILCLGAEGSRACKMTSLLHHLFELPWKLISCEQIEYAANIVNDRYAWLNTIINGPNKELDRDYFEVFRFFKQVCQLPLSREEVSGSKDVEYEMDTTSHESSDWLKRITYIRCVFRLVKKEDEKLPSNLHFTLNSLFESVDIIATNCEARKLHQNFTSVILEIFNNIQKLPEDLQVIKILMKIFKKEIKCESCEDYDRTCKICSSNLSNSFSPSFYLFSISAASIINFSSTDLCSVIEVLIESYMLKVRAQQKKNFDESNINWWKFVFEAFNNSIWEDSTLMKCCTENECLLMIHIYYLYHQSIQTNPNLILDELISSLSLLITKRTDEKRLLLLIDDAFRLVTTEATIELKTDKIITLLTTTEMFSQDKIKSGLLGTIGISRQAFRSAEFRLTVKTFVTFVKKKIQIVNDEEYKQLVNELKQLSSNKCYQNFNEKITFVCQQLLNTHVEYNDFSRYFIEEFFPDNAIFQHIKIQSNSS